MTNRNYVNGVNFERKVKKELEEQGWTVFRTAGSHGIVDLIAFKADCTPKAIQCKLQGAISSTYKTELRDWAKSVGVDGYIAYRNKIERKYVTFWSPV